MSIAPKFKRLTSIAIIAVLICLMPRFTQASPDTAQQELASAKQAMQNLAAAATLPECASCLTNRSAAIMGTASAIGIGISLQMLGASPQAQSDSNLPNDFQSYLSSYGASSSPRQSIAGISPALIAKGREYLTGLGAYTDRLQRLLNRSLIVNKLPKDLSFYTFAVVGPQTVSIVPDNPSVIGMPGIKSMQAVADTDGQWRIDYIEGASNHGQSDADSDKSLSTKMFSAVQAHDLIAVKGLLRDHPELVNVKNDFGEAPLYKAVFFGYPKTCEFLIDHGADVNALNNFGKSILDEAEFGQNQEIVDLLVKHGAKRGAGQ